VKRRNFLKKIETEAKRQGIPWALFTEGANHSIYKLGGKKIPVGRHAEIDNRLAETIFKECEDLLGRGWWR
jgi:hypothetical protein